MPRRIGLLTLPLHTNYGGIVQAAALAQELKALGHEVVFLDKRPSASWQSRLATPVLERLPFQNVKNIRARHRASSVHTPFVAQWIGPLRPKLYSKADMAAAVRRYRIDAVVVGSDQVWRMKYLPRNGRTEFFLDFDMDPTVRRIAYAASFGVDEWEYPELTEKVRDLLARFDAVSVREDSGVALCREVFGRAQCVHVLDPTMLVDPALYGRMAAPPRPRASSGPVLWQYTLDASPEQTATVRAASEILGPGTELRSTGQPGAPRPFLAPDWLAAFRDADFVVTDSFHGTVFSILNGKNFIATPNYDRGAARFISLLKMFGLEDRLAERGDVEAARAIAARPVDYDRVNRRLEEMRAMSRNYLTSALA